MGRHILADYCTSSNPGTIPDGDIADQNSPGPDETMIPDDWCLAMDFANGDILINPALFTNAGIAGDKNPVQSMRQAWSAFEPGTLADVAAMFIG